MPFRFRNRRDNINLYLAFVPEANLYKIGVTTKHPKERLKQIGYFPKIELVHYCSCKVGYEKCLHVKFKNNNVKIGSLREYFNLSESEVQFVINFMNSDNKQRLKMLNQTTYSHPKTGSNF